MDWKTLAAEKKSNLEASIPTEWRIKTLPTDNSVMSFPGRSEILTREELNITESSATELVQDLASGKLSSVAVTTAFCKRGALAQQLTNCCHEFFPELALARAQYLDDYFTEHRKPIGPLHGLPISVKDQVRIKGLETTMGYVSWIGKKDTEDSVLTTMLLGAGAVLYVKTSVPQSLMVCETINNVFGRTTNPRNKKWSCGGSSGGEGAIVAFRGSVIGVGTDIGGSIRVPAAFNFLYGLRPSHGRLPYAKMANSMEGQETIHSVCGPICHSIADMRLFVTSILSQKPWAYDSKVVPMPWRYDEEITIKEKISARGLNLGYYLCDGNVLPHPPVIRAVQKVVNKLSEAGHTVIPWEPYRHPYAVDLANRVYASDGGTDIFSVLDASGEPAIPNIAELVKPDLPKLSLNELWDIQLQKWNYQSDYLARIREAETKLGKELDAIIAPITPTAAIRHDQFKYYGYATAINVLDFTSVVVPVTFVDKKIDEPNYQFKPLTEIDRTVQAEYDPSAYHGAPVAVQIIGRRLTEERVMSIAEEVGRLLGNEVDL
jgi:amidase